MEVTTEGLDHANINLLFWVLRFSDLSPIEHLWYRYKTDIPLIAVSVMIN